MLGKAKLSLKRKQTHKLLEFIIYHVITYVQHATARVISMSVCARVFTCFYTSADLTCLLLVQNKHGSFKIVTPITLPMLSFFPPI